MRTSIFALLVLAASGCARPPGDRGLANRIAEQVEAAAAVDLAELAPFEWDRLHVFAPYTTEAAAEQHMGLPWPDRWAWSDVRRLDDRVFLVFVHEGEIVSAFDYRRADGDFVHSAAPEIPEGGFGPEAARFVVFDRGGGSPVLVPEAAVPSGE